MLNNITPKTPQLFVDKDTITNAVNTSHDLHNQRIDNKVSLELGCEFYTLSDCFTRDRLLLIFVVSAKRITKINSRTLAQSPFKM